MSTSRGVQNALLFLEDVPFDAAKGVFSDAEVRCNDMLRKALQQFGITVHKVGITLLCGTTY